MTRPSVFDTKNVPAVAAFGNSAGTVAEGNDPRFSTLALHAVTHQSGGSDEINVGGLHGLLGDAQPVNCAPGANVTVPANYCLVAAWKYALPASVKLALGASAVMRIL